MGQERRPPIKVIGNVVKGLRPTERDEFYWDADLKGFGVKVTPPSGKHPEGTKVYVFQYRMGGRSTPARRKTIGRHGSPWTPTSARTEAERLALLVGQGIDPVEAESERRRQEVDLNFKVYAEDFIDKFLPVHWPGNKCVAEGNLRLHVIPTLGKKALPAITKSDITKVIDSLSDRTATASNTYAVLRRMFRWAVGRGDLESSIFDGMKPPPKPKKRTRLLSHEELDLFWHAAGDYGFYYGKCMQMLALTGQRLSECSDLPWGELSRSKRLWTLSAERSKNDEPSLIALSDFTIDLLDQIAAKQNGGDGTTWPTKGFVFTTNGASPIANFSRAKARVAGKMLRMAKKRAVERGEDPKEVKIPNWRLHDLRRTLATNCQRLGVRWEVTEAILNHVGEAREGVAGIYQLHKWLREKRHAMQAWADRLRLIVAGERFDDEMDDEFDEFDNVVPLAAARA